MNSRRAFTLIELIIVITLIVIIAAAAFVAIDPAKRLHAARNSTRWSDVTAILEAVKTYQVDNEGDLPGTSNGIDDDADSIQIITDADGVIDCATATCSTALSWPSPTGTACTASGMVAGLRPYLKELPFDGKTGGSSDTRYYINKDQYGIITVGACDAEGEDFGGGGIPPVVEVTR